jgi:Tfp pilus assembly protein PilF
MGIDYRPDHSFRLPRPDLTLSIGTPNACDRCHVDKPTKWSVDAMGKWYGQTSRPHYGQALHAGREHLPAAHGDLVALAGNRLYPTIVRASALAELSRYDGETSQAAFALALADEESLVRQTAIRHLPTTDAAQRLAQLAPLLYDPVRAVRIEAAGALSAVPAESMGPDVRRQFETALAEYRHAMERTADFPQSRHNLGNLYTNLGKPEEAETHYLQAITIDRQFYPAKVNLAMLYNQRGRNLEAEKLLREVVAGHPDFYEIKYSLGLLLAEQGRFKEAAVFMGDAAAGLPQRSRVHYNLGLLLQKIRRDADAEAALKNALGIEPDQPEYLYALAVFYLERRQWEKARQVAQTLHSAHPAMTAGRQLLEVIEKRTDKD